MAKIDDESRGLVKEGIEVYKRIRGDIRESTPFWSLGASSFSDGWISGGRKCADGKSAYIAVWRRNDPTDTISLPVSFFKGRSVKAECIYPSFSESPFEWHRETGMLTVRLENSVSARLYKLTVTE